VTKREYEGYSQSQPTLSVKEKVEGVNIYVTPAESILNKATGFIKAYDFTLNPYRGCQYGCSYCYAAAFSPNQKMRQDWGNWVIVKENAAEILGKELLRWEKKNPDRSPTIYSSFETNEVHR
jgi:DNA repair photolyase